MRKLLAILSLLITISVLSFKTADTKILPSGNLPNQEDPKIINVPPPVLNAFQDLLDEIAANEDIPVSAIVPTSIVWTKDKNEYLVDFRFRAGQCESGQDVFHFVKAKFKANGEIVMIPDAFGVLSRYVYSRTECIRLPF